MSKIIDMSDFPRRKNNQLFKRNEKDNLSFASDEIAYLMKKYDATTGLIILHNPKWGDRPVSQYDGDLLDVKEIMRYYIDTTVISSSMIKKDEITMADLKQSDKMFICLLIIAASILGILGGVGIAFITQVK